VSDPTQIPFLLKLLNDESPAMQKVVAAALAAFGPALEEELEKLTTPPSANQRHKIDVLLDLYTSPETIPPGLNK
jgi:HEAT repeat protein